MKHILLTGTAGFIGSHTSEALLSLGYRVTGIDNFDPFYDRSIKERNLENSIQHPDFELIEGDICDLSTYASIEHASIDGIIHLAAKAGVRPSLKNPIAYYESNVKGTQVLLEFAHRHSITPFIFGSSSSVYGNSPEFPWKEDDVQTKPISPYASTKLSAEMLGHVYSHLYGIRFLALRFFTVFGPRQRPDLAINKFVRCIYEGESIPFYGDGTTSRDYTFVNDIVQGIISALHYKDSAFDVFNIGNNHSVSLTQLVSSIEEVVGKKAIIHRLPPQPGDVTHTRADISKAQKNLHYRPATSFKKGLEAFYTWYLQQS